MPNFTAQMQGKAKKALLAAGADTEELATLLPAVGQAVNGGSTLNAAVTSVLSDATNPAESPTDATTAPVKAKPAKKVRPAAPDGWSAGYAKSGFRRYERRLQGTGHPSTMFQTEAAKSQDELDIVQGFADHRVTGRFIVIDHTTGKCAGFDNWPDAYAFSRAIDDPALAKSVVASIGKDGLPRLSKVVGTTLTIRQIMAEDEEVDA